MLAASATAAAIMGVTGASSKSLAVVASAFGLGNVATDLVAGTYLYQTPPSAALSFVRELQLAYRDGIVSRRSMINAPSAAYHAIQDYLSLCLPPTIETKIAEHIASARAAPDPVTPGAGPNFGLNVVTLPQVTRADIRAELLKNSDVPLQKPVVPAPVTTNRFSLAERSMQKREIKELQTMLCMSQMSKEFGELGPSGSSTRVALEAFLSQRSPTDVPKIKPAQVINTEMRAFC